MEDKPWETWGVGDLIASPSVHHKGMLWKIMPDHQWKQINGPNAPKSFSASTGEVERWAKEWGLYLHKSAAQIRQEAMAQQLADHSDYYNAITGVEP